jgi:agmatinase
VGIAKLSLKGSFEGPALAEKLVPPGKGLLSVTTGSEAGGVLEKYFPSNLTKNWSAEVVKRCQQDWVLIGCPSDAGGSISRGAAQGPLAIRQALYSKSAKFAAHDVGDIACIPQLLHDSMYTDEQLAKSYQSLWNRARKNGESVSPLNVLADICESLFREDRQVFLLGGDHSVSWSMIEALARAGKASELGVLHIDAHTDLMEERFGVAYCYSTWAAHSVKKVFAPNWFQLGVRVSRKAKSVWEKEFGLHQYWAAEVKKKSASDWAEVIAKEWKKNGVQRIYISVDIDGLDPKFAPSTGTAEKGGLSLKFVKELILEITAQFPMVGADVVEVAPKIGSATESKVTLNSAVECLQALLP